MKSNTLEIIWYVIVIFILFFALGIVYFYGAYVERENPINNGKCPEGYTCEKINRYNCYTYQIDNLTVYWEGKQDSFEFDSYQAEKALGILPKLLNGTEIPRCEK